MTSKDVSSRIREASIFLPKNQERGYDAYSLANEKQNEKYGPASCQNHGHKGGSGLDRKISYLSYKEYGSAVRLNGVLTDMPVVVGTPVNESYCGDCEECVRHCPGHIIKGKAWSLRVDRDDLLDAPICKKTIIERGKLINVAEEACGICISVCPWTKRYISRMGAI